MLVLLSLIALGSPARATSVEPRVKLLVREHASLGSRIVDRVAEGKKLTALGRNADGTWTHVQTGRHEGWVPTAQLIKHVVGNVGAAGASDEEEAKPLAKRRSVRPETWVSTSRYHDGEDNKLTVSVAKSELYGRPAAGGAVLGVVRRGEVVQLVRKSTDKKWCLVDVGGGEVAWLDARAVKPGAVKSAPLPSADGVPTVEEPAPAKRLQAEVAAAEPPPPAPAPAPAPAATTTAKSDPPREEEAPPLDDTKGKKSKKAKRPVRLASREGGEPIRVSAPASEPQSEVTVEKSAAAPTARANHFGIGARAGFAVLEQRFTSNTTGALTNYDATTNAFGIIVGAGYGRAVGQYFRFGIDASYAFAGAAAVKYHAPDGDITLGVNAHTIDAGLSAGVGFRALGGLTLRLRVGADVAFNMIQSNVKAPLPSDRVLGMAIGLGLDIPRLFAIGERAFGVRVYGGALAPAQRAQTAGLEEGKNSTTYGAAFGGALDLGLYKGLGLEAAYSYGFALTHFTGQATRNTNITEAERGTSQHLLSLGLAYSL
jgi:hypothetical protein